MLIVADQGEKDSHLGSSRRSIHRHLLDNPDHGQLAVGLHPAEHSCLDEDYNGGLRVRNWLRMALRSVATCRWCLLHRQAD